MCLLETILSEQDHYISNMVRGRCSSSVCSWCDGSSDLSLMVDAWSCGMCYPVCGMMVHMKDAAS